MAADYPEAYEERAYKEQNGFGSAKFPFKSAEYADPASTDYSNVKCPVANNLRNMTVCLFLHPSWSEVHIERCIAGFKKVLKEHLK